MNWQNHGDTYLQDKMYVLRDFRRFIESDRDALKQLRTLVGKLKPILKNDTVKKVIGQLKYLDSNNKQPKFIPTVDLGMIDKYSWATQGSPFSAKNRKQILTTNSIETYMNMSLDNVKQVKLHGSENRSATTVTLTPDEVKRGFGVYRVSCKISGGGYGAYKPWFKDYTCVKEEIAMSFAQQEFARMKASNKGLLFTDVEVHKLNA